MQQQQENMFDEVHEALDDLFEQEIEMRRLARVCLEIPKFGGVRDL